MGYGHTTGSSSTSVKDAPPVATQYLGQFTPLILVQVNNPMFFSQAPSHYRPPLHVVDSSILVGTYFEAPVYPTYYTSMLMSMLNTMLGQMLTYALPLLMIPMQMPMQQSIMMSMPGTFPTHPEFVTPYGYTPIVIQTSSTSLFYEGGSSSQPSDTGVVNT